MLEEKSGLSTHADGTQDGPSWLEDGHGTTACELRSRSRCPSTADRQATFYPFLLLVICIRKYTELCSLSTNCRHVRFSEIENLHIYSRGWDATAKVLYARIKHTRSGAAIFHAILIDQTVSISLLPKRNVRFPLPSYVLRFRRAFHSRFFMCRPSHA